VTTDKSSAGGLAKTLGFGRLALYGVGTIIGAGIYSVVGPAAQSAGDAVWISFLLAAFISAFSGLSYAELATAMPSAGAEHSFLRQALPKAPAVAFAVGLFIAVHGAATFATVGLTFGNYLQTLIALPPVAVALALMAAATAINIAGVTKASAVSAALTTIQVLCLVAFALYALTLKGQTLPTRLAPPQDWGGVLQGAAIVFFIYSGYEHMATLSEEAKDPGRDIWRAFMVALCVTTAVYIAVIFAVLALGDARGVAASEFPLVGAAGKLGRWAALAITGAALLATANAVLNASISGSRLLFGMARAGDLPKALQQTLGGSKSPWVGALVMLGVASVFALLGEMKFVVSLSSLGATLVFASVNAAVIILRYAKPDLDRPFRVPSIGRFPVTAGLGVAASLLLAAQYEWKVYATFAVAILTGAVPYAVIRSRGGKGRDVGKPRG
jgi:basic amino acid/polyamine antiporter, APA family